MRAPIIVATATVGALIFQGCKNDGDTQTQHKKADDAIEAYQALIKTDHTEQQCHDLATGPLPDEVTEKADKIKSLQKKCLETAKDSKTAKAAFEKSKAATGASQTGTPAVGGSCTGGVCTDDSCAGGSCHGGSCASTPSKNVVVEEVTAVRTTDNSVAIKAEAVAIKAEENARRDNEKRPKP